MSTLEADNIKKGSKTVDTDYLLEGSLKSWVKYNGTGVVAIQKSLNVSSVVDDGTGESHVTLTAAMVDDDYCLSLGVDHGPTSWARIITSGHPTQQTTTVYHIVTSNSSAVVTDCTHSGVHVVGDLA